MSTRASTDESLRPGKRFWQGATWNVLLFCVCLIPAIATAATDCNSLTDRGERLKCKFDALADAGKKTIDYLQQPPFSNLATPSQMTGLTKYKEQLDRAKSRLRASDFRSMTKKRDSRCQLVEKEGNGDGVCEPEKGEVCAEALGDGVGDEDGICSPMHGRKREVCAQICDEEAIASDATNEDASLSSEVEGLYDDMNDHAEEMNNALPEVAALVTAQQTQPEEGEACPVNAEGLTRVNFVIYVLARTAAVTSRGGADIAERACDQQVMFNCAACCAPAEIVAGAFEAAWTAIEITENTINSATIDATLSCVASLKASADSNAQLLEKIQTSLNELEAAQNETLRLLALPQGQRSGTSSATTSSTARGSQPTATTQSKPRSSRGRAPAPTGQ